MPIATDYGIAPFTIKQVASATGCCPRRSTAKLQNIADRIWDIILADPGLWAKSQRPDRVARGIQELMKTVGQLAEAAPDQTKTWLRGLAERRIRALAEGEIPNGP